MITTATGVAIKKATISGKNINDNKTDFYLVKVKHIKLFTVSTKKVSKVFVRY